MVIQRIIQWCIALTAPILLPFFSTAAQETKQTSLADDITALTTAYQEEVDAYYKKYRAANTAEERQALSESLPDAGEVVQPLMSLVSSDPTSEEAATAAIWVLRNARATPPEGVIDLLKAQLKLERFSDIALACLYGQSEPVSAVLEQAIDENPHSKARAAAAFARSYVMARAVDPDDATLEKRRRFLEIALEHGTSVMLGTRSIADRAKASIFETENLQIGMTAPDIKGEDIDGVEFALSDYRGRIVVIDFWGDW